MKPLLALLFLALSLPAFAQPQGVSMRSTNGAAFGATTHFRATSNHFSGAARIVGTLNASGAINAAGAITGGSVVSSGEITALGTLNLGQSGTPGELQIISSENAAESITVDSTGFQFTDPVNASAFIGDGTQLTGISSLTAAATNFFGMGMFTNIAEMSASTLTNRVAFVGGYWGTNTYGGGFFRHYPQAETTNFGTIFTNVNGGNWHRDRPEGTNIFRLVDFGVPPMNTDAPVTRFDAYQRLTNLTALALVSRGSIIELTPYGFMVTQDWVLTNAFGLTIRGSSGGSGPALTYPLRSSWISYQGPGGANSRVIYMPSAYYCTLENFGVETSTPVYVGGGYYPTNNARYAIEFDQASTYSQICSGNRIENVYVRSRGTNVAITALSISRTSANNCERFSLVNFGANIVSDGSNTGEGVLIGSSANSRQHSIFNLGLIGGLNQIGIVLSNGGFTMSGENNFDGFGFDGKFVTWAAGTVFGNAFSENGRQGVWVGSGSSGLPMLITRYGLSHSQRDGSALIELHGSAEIELSRFDPHLEGLASQQVFTNDPGFSAKLDSRHNEYGINYEVNSGFLGLTNFVGGWKTEFDDINSGRPAEYQGIAGYQFQVYDNATAFKSNRVVFDMPVGAAIRLSPNGNRVHVGSPPGAVSAYNFVVDSGSTNSPKISFGDQTIVSRYKFESGSNVGDTFFDMFSTNNRSSTIRLYQLGSAGASFAELDLASQNNRNDIRFVGALGLQIRQGVDNGATAHAVFNANGTTDFFPTNVGIGVKVNGWLGASNLSSFLTMPTNGILWQGGAQLTNIYTATATLDFGNAATIGCSDLTMTVTGAALGDVVDLGVPNASVVANSSFSAWVSAADTVTVRYCALISGDPASGVFRAEVHKWK